jgi:tetratricopeptide (TPR) repeat protein
MYTWLTTPVVLQAGDVFELAEAPTRGATTTQALPIVLGVGAVLVAVGGYFVYRHLRREEDEPVVAGPATSQTIELDHDQRDKLRQANRQRDYLEAARVLRETNRHAEAAENFARAEAWRDAAEAYDAADRIPEAIHYYKKAGDRRRAAKMYAEQERFREAAAEFVAADKPELAASYYERAEEHRRAADLYADGGEHLEAARNFEQTDHPEKAARQYAREFVRALDEADGEVDGLGPAMEYARKAGEYFEEADNYAKAAEVYRRAEMLEPAAEMLREDDQPTRAAKMLRRAGQVDRAVELLQEAGETERAHRAQGEQAYEAGDYGAAAEAFERAGDLAKAAKLYEQGIGEPLKAAELYERAEEWLKAARAYKKADRYADAAHCAEQGGELAKAAVLYGKAGDIDAEIRVRKSQGDYFRAGGLLFEQRRYDEALETLQRINSRDPIHDKGLELQGDVYRSMEAFERAYSRYRAALGNRGASEETVPLLYKMARVLEAERDFDDAIEHYEQVLEVDDEFEDAAERLEELRQASRDQISEPAEAENPSQGLVASRHGRGISHEAQEPEDDSELRYELVEELARGGMGVVYQARDTFLNRIVAVKLLGEDLRDNETAVKYFLREARAAAALAHPNIVTIFDAGEQDGEYYIAMEYVEGETLKEKINRGLVLDEDEVRQILVQSCKALEYAHDQEVIHRDIKSGNIMSKPDGTVKIMDFGLAKFLREYQQNHTQQVGTPYYMSPEQIIGENVDFRSDLYGLGCTAFECVTGRVPFTEGELAYHHVHTEPPSPSEFNEELSDEMEEIILRLLQKDPDDRYESASALKEVLS